MAQGQGDRVVAGRRANGDGTVPTRKRKDGRWEAKAWLPTTGGGEKRISFYGKTRAEAREKMIAAQAQVVRGVPIPGRMPRLGDYLDYWLKDVIRPNQRRTTYCRYESAVRLHLKPGLGKYHLTRLTVPVAQTFFSGKLARGASVRNAHIMREVLSSALGQAVREELLNRNVARLVKLPSYQPEEVRPWAADEARRFLEAAQNESLYSLFVILLLYGLREGEVLGMRWTDIDFTRGLLYVEQQLQCVQGERYTGPVKTRSGQRMLAMIPLSLQVLRAQQRRQAEQRREAGDTWKGSSAGEGFVFTTSSGLPQTASNLNRSFRRILKQHGIRRIRIHDLRHTNSTWLKDFGVPERDKQAMLGHSDGAMTRKYEHGNWDTSQRATARIAEVLQGNTTVVRNGRQVLGPLLRPHQLPLVGAAESAFSNGFGAHSHPTLERRTTSIRTWIELVTRHWLVGSAVVNIGGQIEMALQDVFLAPGGDVAAQTRRPA
jgi:integrase